MNLPPEVHSNVDLHSPSGVHSNVNLPPEVHSNVNLCSPFEAHSNVNHPLPSLKCISLEDQLNVDPPSPPLQHIPHSLKRDFNGKIKSGSGQVRPNTSISFIPSCSNLLPSSPANVLHAVGIAELLQQYPNRRFVDTITTIVTSGVRVGFEGSNLGQTSRPNHASAFAHPDIITKSIQSEISKGRIKEIDSLPANYFCSPIGLTPKMLEGKQTGWRTIFDLSSPHGHSVNDGIPKEYGSLVYETLGNAIRLVAQAGKGAVMMKRDLKSAFRHVPIDPCDYWLLMFEWQGKFYVDMFLPFGLRTAPRIFNLFAEALHWIFDTLHEWNVTHYLDDFLFVFPPGTDLSPHSLQFDQVLSSFGLSKAAEKDSNGCVVVHLGFEFNSSTMEVTLPPNKKQRAVDAVSFLLSSPSVSSPDHPNPSMSSLHQKLRSFFTTQSLPLPGEVTTLHANPTNSSARIMAIHHSLPPSQRLHIGQPNSCKRSNQTPPRATLMQSAPFTLNATSLSKYSVIPGSIFSSEVENGSTATKERNSGFLSQHQSSSESSMKSPMMRKESMSRQRSVWHLPPSYDLENLHGIHGLPNITSSISLVHTSNSIPTTR